MCLGSVRGVWKTFHKPIIYHLSTVHFVTPKSKNNSILVTVCMGVWGSIFEDKGTLRGSCQELFYEFESPSLLAAVACAVLLLQPAF